MIIIATYTQIYNYLLFYSHLLQCLLLHAYVLLFYYISRTFNQCIINISHKINCDGQVHKYQPATDWDQ